MTSAVAALWPCSSCQKGFVGVRQGGLDTRMEHRNPRVAWRGTLVLKTLRQLGRPMIHQAHFKMTGRPSELGACSSSDALLPPTAATLGRSTVGAYRLDCGHPSIAFILLRENTQYAGRGGAYCRTHCGRARSLPGPWTLDTEPWTGRAERAHLIKQPCQLHGL